MQTEPVLAPEDLQKKFEHLQAELRVVQNELDQALGVWRTILASEKQEFKKALADREKSWEHDEILWQKDRQAIEDKVKEFETLFTRQLDATEKNAVRALNELDSAWQAERQRWQNTLAQQTKEARQQSEIQKAAQSQLEERLARLTEENAGLQASLAEIPSLQSEIASWEAEKSAWQESLSERMNEFRQQEAVIQSLQEENGALRQSIAQLESQLNESQAAIQTHEQNFNSYVRTLEGQIAGFQEFIEQVVASHPLRRKTDHPQAGPRAGAFLWPPSPRVSRGR